MPYQVFKQLLLNGKIKHMVALQGHLMHLEITRIIINNVSHLLHLLVLIFCNPKEATYFQINYIECLNSNGVWPGHSNPGRPIPQVPPDGVPHNSIH